MTDRLQMVLINYSCDEQKIRDCLLNGTLPEIRVKAEHHFRQAAVLVPLLCIDDEWNILFTRRTETVNNHKGQVSFPGGAIEKIDQRPEDGAIRETREELGIKAGDINILGRLPRMTTLSGYLITPVVASIKWPVELSLEADEVSRVFSIPIKWLACSDHYEQKTVNLMGKEVKDVVFFRPYDGEILWGITAMITLQLISRMFNKI